MLTENRKDLLVMGIMILILLVVAGPRPLLLVPLLWLPGRALVALFFPGGVPDRAAGLLFSLGLSVAVLIAGGLILNLVEPGITPGRMAIFAGAVTLAAAALAYTRREFKGWPVLKPDIRFSLRETVLISAAVCVAGIAVMMARQPAPAAPEDGYTVLWMVPQSADSRTFEIGIDNQELEPVRYNLELYAGERYLNTWSEIALEPGEVWEEMLRLPQHESHPDPVRLLLYRVDNPENVYRYTTSWNE